MAQVKSQVAGETMLLLETQQWKELKLPQLNLSFLSAATGGRAEGGRVGVTSEWEQSHQDADPNPHKHTDLYKDSSKKLEILQNQSGINSS